MNSKELQWDGHMQWQSSEVQQPDKERRAVMIRDYSRHTYLTLDTLLLTLAGAAGLVVIAAAVTASYLH